MVLANTAELYDRIDVLTARIRALEEALTELREGHALLVPELLAIKHPPKTTPPPADGQPGPAVKDKGSDRIEERMESVELPGDENTEHKELQDAFGARMHTFIF